MFKSKKIYSIILTVAMFFSIGVFSAFANENITDNDMQNAVQAQYIGEQNGAKVYSATIPVEWHSFNNNDDVSALAASDCDCTIYYWGNGVWEYNLTFKGLDLIKYLNGDLSTYGVGGSTSTTLQKTNMIPGPVITVNKELHFLHPVQSGYQYFKVSGTVTGVNGYGSFGPQVNSIYVTV